jgi:hypothetical protein
MSKNDKSQFQAFHSTLDELFKSKKNTIVNLDILSSSLSQNTTEQKIIPMQIQKETKTYDKGGTKGHSRGDGQAPKPTISETLQQIPRETSGRISSIISFNPKKDIYLSPKQELLLLFI